MLTSVVYRRRTYYVPTEKEATWSATAKATRKTSPFPSSKSLIHSGHLYSAPSSPLLLRGAPDYSTDTVSESHAEAYRQLQVKDLPKVLMWWLERESNPRPSS